MELKKIKDNLDNFEIKTDTIIDENNFYLKININDVTKEFLKGFIPQKIADKRDALFLPSDEIKKRHLVVTLVKTELQQYCYGLLLFEENLIKNKETEVLILGIDEGMNMTSDLRNSLIALVEMSAKVESLKQTMKLEAKKE